MEQWPNWNTTSTYLSIWQCLLCIVAHKFEINGYLARRTLIRLTLLLQETASDQADITSTESECVQRIIRLLYNLCYIQELAYAKESRRTAKNILALHNLTYVFFLDYKKVSRNFADLHFAVRSTR